jgi:hypothetical protein
VSREVPTWAIVCVIVGGVLTLSGVGVAAAVDLGALARPAPPPATPSAAAAASVAPAGTTVRDGKFEFTVNGAAECGRTQIGQARAQSRYCSISLTVRNIGEEAHTFSAGNQNAYDESGAKFEVDGVASMHANPSGGSFGANVNPSGQIAVTIVFDVATEVRLVTLELHDSTFSRGAKVALP